MASRMPRPGPDRPLRIVLVRLGIAKVDEQAIAEILGNIPSKRWITSAQAPGRPAPPRASLRDRVRRARRGRVHQVTEHDRELAPFGVRGLRGELGVTSA